MCVPEQDVSSVLHKLGKHSPVGVVNIHVEGKKPSVIRILNTEEINLVRTFAQGQTNQVYRNLMRRVSTSPVDQFNEILNESRQRKSLNVYPKVNGI